MTCQLLAYNLKTVDLRYRNVNTTDKVNCVPGFVRKTVRIKRAENVRIL